MKILLCYPPVSDNYDKIRDAGMAPHLSLICLATHVTNKYSDVEVIIKDGHHDDYNNICETIKLNNFDLIGLSVDFTNYESGIKIADFAKQNNGNTLIGMGSNHASNMCREILDNQKSIDFIGMNDGEEQLEKYIAYMRGQAKIEDVPNLMYRDNDGNVAVNKLKTFDLKYMYPPNYELVDLSRYFALQREVFGGEFKMLQFTTQRGCANKPLCVFCGRFDDGMRFRDPLICAKEVAYYVEKYKLTEVWDRSDSFIQNKRWLKTFAEELNKLTDRFANKTTTFKTYSRADQLLDKEVIETLKMLNFRMVFIGYEAGDDSILKNIGKNANIDCYLEASKNVLENNIQIDASFIVGLPGENRESMQNHISFVADLVKLGLKKIRVNRLLVLPGTPLYKEILSTFPELRGQDILDMQELQKKLFMTKYYDLSEFDNNVDTFIQALNDTANEMVGQISSVGGSSEGYGHGKGRNISKGSETK